MTNFLDLLKERIIIFDGAMGTYLQSLNLSIDDWGGPAFENCSENLLYTRPDAIESVHSAFLDTFINALTIKMRFFAFVFCL